MEKVKKIVKNKEFWLFALITIIFFGTFIKMEYATDTYSVFATNRQEIIAHFMQSGRFVTAFSGWISTKLALGNTTIYLISVILAFACTSISMYKLYTILKAEIKNNLVLVISAILLILNVFSIELYLFLEKGVLMLSVLLCVLAFEKMIKFFEGDKKAILWVFVYMLIANFSYQGTVALFVALCTLYIIKNAKNIKTFIINNIYTAICYGIPALVNYLTVKVIYSNPRVSAENNLLLSIEKIIDGTKYMIGSTYSILPKYFFVGVLSLIIFVGIINILRQKETAKKKILLILGIVYIILVTTVFTIFPQIMQSTASISFVPRSTYAFASIIGLVLAYLCMNVKLEKISQDILIGILIIYLSLQYIGFQNIIRDRYILNYMDYNQFLQIQNKVQKYEEETGNKIEKISLYPAEYVQYSYPNLFVSGDTNLKAMFPEWARKSYLEYYFNRTFTQVEQNQEIYEQYFKDKNWTFFDDEQIVLIEDTMHIYVY